ncbi:MAG: glutathione S-transferase N-terminal domain-containing protein [Burkholderiales bacterium]
MPLKLWDLAAAEDDRRFSLYRWRIKMALAHKGLEPETVPWRFTEKPAIAFSGQDKVPVLVDDGREVHDSWAIAQYLEEKYPARPLFESAQAKALAFVFKGWVETVLHGPILRAVILDLFAALHEKDKPYFRESREKRFGRTLEEFGADPKKAAADLRTALLPVRQQLVQAPYVCGQAPAFADYILFGAFQWARAVSPQRLLEPDDPVFAWRERLLDLHGGLARQAKGYPVWA